MPWTKLPDGTVVHLCTRGRGPWRTKNCNFCGRPATLLCDGPVRGRKFGGKRTCSKHLCPTCADSRGPNLDFCPQCAKTNPKQLELP